ncbi:tRNA-modifying protein YgfZ [uncultured Gammaproteobacteria bacterium]
MDATESGERTNVNRRAALVLPGRAVLGVTGPDRISLLNGLLTADLRRLTPDRALYGLLLTAQGRFQHDFFLIEHNDSLLIETTATRAESLVRTLLRYRLRAKVAFEDLSDRFTVMALTGADAATVPDLPTDPGAARPYLGGAAFVDPRLAGLGVRVIIPTNDGLAALAPPQPSPASPACEEGKNTPSLTALETLRLIMGIPDGEADLIADKSSPLEFNLDHLNAIAFDKGCYLGQEATARGHFRSQVRKRLLPATITGPLPPSGTVVLCDGREAGEVRSGLDGIVLALLRLEEVERAQAKGLNLTAAETRLKPYWPSWLDAARLRN